MIPTNERQFVASEVSLSRGTLPTNFSLSLAIKVKVKRVANLTSLFNIVEAHITNFEMH